MKSLLAPLGAALLLAASSSAQVELIYQIEKPSEILNGWGDSVRVVDDLDGDGVPELLVGVFGHAQPVAATMHSGATGALLYTLDTPFVPLFWGDGLVPIADETGDELGEIIVLGGHSGDSNSPDGRLRVHSGADGSLLREVDTPAGLTLFGHTLAASLDCGDVDGDGSADILCRSSSISPPGWAASLISSATGQPLYTVVPQAPRTFIGDFLARLSDHDGDGLDDFAIPVFEDGRRRIEVRSTATGALLATLNPTGIEMLTGNGEPFLSISDRDGDGLRDLAIGSVFTGFAAVISSADGSTLQSWDCDTQDVPCLGAMLAEITDLNGDGQPDLLAVETSFVGMGEPRLFGLDPLSGAQIFESIQPGLAPNYSSEDKLVVLPGADPAGFPTIAMVSGFDLIQVQRIVPELGSRGCTSVPNSSGAAATIHVYGDVGPQASTLLLELEGAPGFEPGYFVYGSQAAQQPFGGGFLCVGGQIGRLTPIQADANGHAQFNVDLSTFGSGSTTWTFQAVFRDSAAGGGFQSSDAITVPFER